MAYTKTQVANLALNALGADTVSDIASRSSPHAIRVAASFDLIYDEVLEAHPWHFAKKLQYLPSTGSPLFGRGYAFALPTMPWCLRPLTVDDEPPGEGSWSYAGRELLADRPGPLPLVFIARVDLSFASAQFAATLGYRLAAQVAFAVTNDRDTEKTMWSLYRSKLADARSLNAQSSPPDDGALEGSALLRARY